jgi:hypothetical protein
MFGYSCVAEKLVASQEELSFMESVSFLHLRNKTFNISNYITLNHRMVTDKYEWMWKEVVVA